jgi:hypothetical protein
VFCSIINGYLNIIKDALVGKQPESQHLPLPKIY